MGKGGLLGLGIVVQLVSSSTASHLLLLVLFLLRLHLHRRPRPAIFYAQLTVRLLRGPAVATPSLRTLPPTGCSRPITPNFLSARERPTSGDTSPASLRRQLLHAHSSPRPIMHR
jgi:hypothetical protein